MKLITEAFEGDRLIGFFLIKDLQQKVATNGSEYFDFVLGDRSGTITAKLWDITEEQKGSFTVKKIVKVDGLVTLFRNQKQLQIQRIRLSLPEDDIDIQTLVQKSEIPREELWQELRMVIEEIQSPTLSKLVKTILLSKETRDALTTIPAGVKMHHSYYAGLLEHIVTLLHSATQLFPIYPQLNKDIVITTCLLHDIGKTKELSDPIAPEYTTEGELVGHIVLGIELINDAAREAGISSRDEELLLVKHCILSHHGDVDLGYGSAVSGKVPEAIFFHYLDQIDAKLNSMKQLFKGENEEWVYSPMLRRKIRNLNKG
ncbi:HD domain-containing protein [Anaerobacillus sp. CMMVII]|uniref:3'-5' exoribonuclease YhaM family protein n=1 Tax=Anaerobacillus sp. CMMVII TaxID=2755588 RepID=UPI0021B799E5|nr:HD domain-containing protein [Anaerobacillus sp. CMMVII]MCT8137374.1 HD domain-containing protein [Anaerobacillus sp. CMMVII]